MKSLLKVFTVMALCSASLFGGDAAVFQELGFSSDGQYYLFAQYGKCDKTFFNYADLWTVDMAQNDFVNGKSFHTSPAQKITNVTSRETFTTLKTRAEGVISECSPVTARGDQTLYLLEEEDKRGDDTIIFTDFEKTIRHGATKEYTVNLIKEVTGLGAGSQSSFIINLSSNNNDTGAIVARQTFGNSALKRPGVTDYKIIKIVFNEVSRSIVFVIEKTIVDDTGLNLRYMVETGRLNSDF